MDIYIHTELHYWARLLKPAWLTEERSMHVSDFKDVGESVCVHMFIFKWSAMALYSCATCSAKKKLPYLFEVEIKGN